jgi:hypothetical protein
MFCRPDRPAKLALNPGVETPRQPERRPLVMKIPRLDRRPKHLVVPRGRHRES